MTPTITATDLNPSFLEAARAGVYPEVVLEGMTAEERSWFEPAGTGEVRVPDATRRQVEFLPPRSFLDPLDARYDAVLLLNALTYVSPAEQSLALQHAAAASRHLLALTAFHPDTIRADLGSAGFEPVLEDQRLIHEAWGDRLAPHPVPEDRPEYSWRLPPFDTAVPDRTYRFCSLSAGEIGRALSGESRVITAWCGVNCRAPAAPVPPRSLSSRPSGRSVAATLGEPRWPCGVDRRLRSSRPSPASARSD